MNRVLSALILSIGALSCAQTFAQPTTPVGEVPQGVNVRRFPDVAMRGSLVVQIPPEVTINGKAERLAPGARIFNPQNMMLMSGSISGQKLLINYTKDTYGLVKDVWVLSAEEAKLKPPAQLKADRDKAIAAQQQ